MGRVFLLLVCLPALLWLTAGVAADSTLEVQAVVRDTNIEPRHRKRITETLQVARKLHESDRRLLTCEQSLPEIEAALGSGASASCECVEIGGTNSSFVNCNDYCRLCRDELRLCVSYTYGFNFVQGNLTEFAGRLVYDGSRTDTLEFSTRFNGDNTDISTCSTSINGVQCNSCSASTGNCVDGVVYDCSNIEPGAIYDECPGEFQTIPSTSVLVAYNPNFFDDNDCVFFPTVSPIPTETPFPTLSPTIMPTVIPTIAPTMDISPTRPPFISLNLNRFRIGVEFTELNEGEFIQTIVNYLLNGLSNFFPELAGIILTRTDGTAVTDDEGLFVFDGEAIFLGKAPNLRELEAAQRFILSDIVAVQETITSNPNTGRDVFVVAIVVDPDTFAPTPAPKPPPVRGKGFGKGNGKGIVNPWDVGVSYSKSKKGKKGKKHSKKSDKKSDKKMKKSKDIYHNGYKYSSIEQHVSTPTYYYNTPPKMWRQKSMKRSPPSSSRPGHYAPAPSPSSSWNMNRGGMFGTWRKKRVPDSRSQGMMRAHYRMGRYSDWHGGMMGSWKNGGTWSQRKRDSPTMTREYSPKRHSFGWHKMKSGSDDTLRTKRMAPRGRRYYRKRGMKRRFSRTQRRMMGSSDHLKSAGFW